MNIENLKIKKLNMATEDITTGDNATSTPAFVFVSGAGETESDGKTQGELLLDLLKKRGLTNLSIIEAVAPSWDTYLTPWPAEGVLKGRRFEGKAEEFLSVLETAVSEIAEQPCYLAGYSLAGLFVLWALTKSNYFKGCVCCSGSLWYPDFTKYMEDFCKDASAVSASDKNLEIYLSLGNKEPLTKHPVMSKVGEATEHICDLLKTTQDVDRMTFEWNEGGHFNEPLERIARGIAWICS